MRKGLDILTIRKSPPPTPSLPPSPTCKSDLLNNYLVNCVIYLHPPQTGYQPKKWTWGGLPEKLSLYNYWSLRFHLLLLIKIKIDCRMALWTMGISIGFRIKVNRFSSNVVSLRFVMQEKKLCPSQFLKTPSSAPIIVPPWATKQQQQQQHLFVLFLVYKL